MREDDIRLLQRLGHVEARNGLCGSDELWKVLMTLNRYGLKGLLYLNAPHLENWQWLLIYSVALTEKIGSMQCRGKFYSKEL
jgi:hypothetical protein